MKPLPPWRVFVGYEPSQTRAVNVAVRSLHRHARPEADVTRLSMSNLRSRGLYARPTEVREHGYWDVISEAPMSTGHAISRFLVPALCKYSGWALFTDGDVLFRCDIGELFALAEESKAVQVVQHQHVPKSATKMEGHAQTIYARKNWSSVMLFNSGHPANQALTVELVNTVPGRDLHRFCWLTDDQIGALPSRWNVLIGDETDFDPAICHFTNGAPDVAGYEHQDYADEWYAVAKDCGYTLPRPALA